MDRDSADGRAAGAGGRLTDEEIRALARAIRDAVRRPPGDDWRDDICSVHHELPAADEDRLIAALARDRDAD
jgi:hypothetical protein